MARARFGGQTSLAKGTTIEARIGGTVCGSTKVLPKGQSQGQYHLDVDASLPAPHGTVGCGFPGATVEFWANNAKVGQAAWASGLTTLNLP